MWMEIKICVYYRLRLQSSSCGRSLNVIKRCEFLFLAAGASAGKKISAQARIQTGFHRFT